MAQGMEEEFKLYAGKTASLHPSLAAAQEEAKKYIPAEPYLRIEGIVGPSCDDWWAYEYENQKWARS